MGDNESTSGVLQGEVLAKHKFVPRLPHVVSYNGLSAGVHRVVRVAHRASLMSLQHNTWPTNRVRTATNMGQETTCPIDQGCTNTALTYTAAQCSGQRAEDNRMPGILCYPIIRTPAMVA